MTDQPREVIGVCGQIQVVGPNDKLLVVIPQGIVGYDAAIEIAKSLRATFGDRVFVMQGDVEIGVIQND